MPVLYFWALGVTVLAVAVLLLWLGLRAQKNRTAIGNEAMVGETGVVKRAAGFRGRIVIEARGETWWSRLEGQGAVKPGDEVRITGFDPGDMILKIEPIGRG